MRQSLRPEGHSDEGGPAPWRGPSRPPVLCAPGCESPQFTHPLQSSSAHNAIYVRGMRYAEVLQTLASLKEALH